MTDQWNIAPEHVTNGQLFMLLQAVNNRLGVMQAEQVRLRSAIEQQERDTADMLSAWKAGGTVLRFIKLVGALALAVTATWAVITTFFPKGG